MEKKKQEKHDDKFWYSTKRPACGYVPQGGKR